jgi:hypothetical protein
MKEDIENIDKNVSLQRDMQKKNTFFMRHKKLNLEYKIQRHDIRSFSTKLISNFVPQIRPKKSFTKPTFFQLDETDSNTPQNEKINEIEEDNSSSDEEDEIVEERKDNQPGSSSSDFESDEGQNENSPSNESNEIENNNKMKLDVKVYKEDDDCFQKKNIDCNVENVNNNNFKNESNLELNNLNNDVDKIKNDVNLKQNNLTQKKFIVNSIFDILSNNKQSDL